MTVTEISPKNGSYIGNSIYLKGSGLVDLGNVYLNFNATSSSSANGFAYTVRSDNTPTQFGIDFTGCSNGTTIKLNYLYKTTLYSNTYTCLNTLTPTVNLVTANSLAYNAVSQPIVFNRVLFPAILPNAYYAYPIDTNGKRFGADIPLTYVSASGATFTVDGTPLTTGKYAFKFVFSANKYGTALVNSSLTITSSTTPTIAADVNSAYTGGAHITVSGAGLSKFASLTVGGVNATLISSLSNTDTLVFNAPPLVTKLSQDAYHLVDESILTGTLYADTLANAGSAYDKLMSTRYTSAAAACYIGLDFGANQQADITKIRFYPNPTWKSALTYIKGAQLAASVDGTTWVNLTVLDSTVHTGWNIWKPQSALTTYYRYVAFRHNSTSACNLAEFEVSGYLYAGSVTSLSSNSRAIALNNGVQTTAFTQNVNYESSLTPLVTNISPRYASPVGGTDITITGSGFGTDASAVTVVIDGVTCSVQGVTDTSIVCTTGARGANPSSFSFVVSVGGNVASLDTDTFLYAYRWSDTLTWGGDFAPIDGDTVYVPKGMVLLVDQTTPNLYLILVEGTIIFADESDMTIESHFIIIEHGVFQAGTENQQYNNKLTFILHGDYYDTQLPGFGNKVIGCHACTFDMHGQTRNVTWTELAQTANSGENKIYLTTAVDWQVGEVIVIAASGFDHTQSEQHTIAAINAERT